MEKKILKKLEEILEYFKIELSLVNKEYTRSIEDRRFNFNMMILILSAFIVLISSTVQAFLSPEWLIIFPGILKYVLILFSGLIIVLFYSIGHHIYYDWKDYKNHFDKRISLELIIKYLLHLKFTDITEEDLNELINRIKFDFRDYRKAFIGSRKEYINFEEKRLIEFIRLIDKINLNIVSREKK
jgi:hypothetical protein